MATTVLEAEDPSALSRWTSRIAIFSAVLLLAAFTLHRLFGMPTPIAINLAVLAYIGALVSFLTGLAAAVGIWMHGGAGTARIVGGVLIGLFMIGGALAMVALAGEHPPINDVTTDAVQPPEFDELLKERGAYANVPDYPGEAFAKIQSRAFPDITTMHIDRAADETFSLVTDALKRLRIEIIKSAAPGEGKTDDGTLEAVDRTLIAGFYDDIAVRVAGDGERARVDIRSASRYGKYDYGRNAERVRAIMREINGRLAASVPGAAEPSKDGKKPGKSGVKPGKDGDPKSEGRRKSRDRAQ
jgi:uncharacterized protein (DUF1499 family)